jgi:hypothetical protein
MSSMMSMPLATRKQFPTSGDELLFDYRQRRALEEQERADLKVADQAQQCSALNSAASRIRAWEKVHHLCMPSDPQHLVLGAIAVATQLTLGDIQNEQRLRSAQRASVGL